MGWAVGACIFHACSASGRVDLPGEAFKGCLEAELGEGGRGDNVAVGVVALLEEWAVGVEEAVEGLGEVGSVAPFGKDRCIGRWEANKFIASADWDATDCIPEGAAEGD